ncbi:MAG: porin, partial [Chlorobiales bacterium]|nr:porin [Chlorobiales bacterium]
GFRADMMYGTDAQKTQAFGQPTGWDTEWDNGVYGWAIPQAYLELARGDFSVKAGHFYTLVGYEVVTAPDNFFYSHAFTMFNSEPFTHTGVLATYTGSDLAEFYAGYTLGWDTGFDRYSQNGTSGSNWLGGFSTDLTNDITMTYISTFGDFGRRNDPVASGYPTAITAGADLAYSHSLVFDVQLNNCMNYVLQSDLVSIDEVDHEQVGINQYLFYTINDCWTAGARFEWFDDEDGQRVVTNAVGDYYALTLGLNYRPNANLVIRPEIRWDWFDDDATATALPFDNGTEDEQFSGGFDFIVTF